MVPALDMFPFELFTTLFLIIFILTSGFILFVIIMGIVRAAKTGGAVNKNAESQPVIKEKEIIREIVKIRCSYCGNLYDENLDKCPHCGAKKD